MKTLRILTVAVAFGVLWVISAAIAQLVISPPVSDVVINGHTYTNQMLQANPAGWLGGVANDIGIVTAAYPNPASPFRVKLNASLDMYVSASSGSDSANCLVNNPCQTLQRPFNLLRDGYDLANNTVTVHLADGTYSPGLKLSTKLLGQADTSNLRLVGNAVSPQNVVISDTRTMTDDTSIGSPIFVSYGGNLQVENVTLVASRSSALANVLGTLRMINVRYAGAGVCHMQANAGAQIRIGGDYAVFASAAGHICAFNGGLVSSDMGGGTIMHVTITNNPSFSIAFAYSSNLSQISMPAASTQYTGAAIGRTFLGEGLSLLTTGTGTSFFPGSIAGLLVTGAVYQ